MLYAIGNRVWYDTDGDGLLETGEHGADGVAQFVQAGALRQVTGGAVVERAAHHPRIIVGGDHDHRDPGMLCANRGQAGQAMIAGHMQVQQNQVDLRLRLQDGEHAGEVAGFQQFNIAHRIASGLP